MPDPVSARPGFAGPAPANEPARLERAMVTAVLLARSWHLIRAGNQIAVAWKSYRNPTLALTAYLGTIAESVWLFRRRRRGGTCDDRTALLVDFATVAAANVVTKRTLASEHRMHDLDWGVAMQVSQILGLGLGTGLRFDGAIIAATAATSGWAIQRRGLGTFRGDPEVSMLVPLVGLVFAVTAAFASRSRSIALELQEARLRETDLQERVSRGRVRDEHFRLLRSRVLPPLEGLASGWDPSDEDVRRRLRAEGSRIRHMLQHGTTVSERPDLQTALADVADNAAAHGLRTELVQVALVADPPTVPPEAIGAIADATREALDNVRRHSGTSVAVVCTTFAQDRVEVTVRDHGRGYAPGPAVAGYGIREGMEQRLRDVGGTAEITTAPGEGTLVTFALPCRGV